MTLANCASALKKYEYINRISKLRADAKKAAEEAEAAKKAQAEADANSSAKEAEAARKAQAEAEAARKAQAEADAKKAQAEADAKKAAEEAEAEIATEHLIAYGCRLITAVSLHCKLSLTRLLQSIAVILYPHEYVEGFVYNESE